MPSAKTSTVLGLVRHATTLRLTRIATLVAGSLVFLYACEVSRKSDLSDVWTQLAIAAALALTGLITAWFEVRAADHAVLRARTEIRGFLIESDGISVRARITRSGDLVFHGHDSTGTHPAYEWDWAFRAGTFPAIRAALGGKGDLLELLECTVPHWDRRDRYDPGAWLHNQGIPAAFRERGDSSSRITRVLPVIKPEPEIADHDRDAPPFGESTGPQELTSTRRTTSPHRRSRAADHDRPERSGRGREPAPEQSAPTPTRRRALADQRRSTPSADDRADQPAARRGELPARRRNQPPKTQRYAPASDPWDAPLNDDFDEPPNTRWHEPPGDRWDAPSSDRHNEALGDRWDAPLSSDRDTPSSDHRSEPSSARWNAPPNSHSDAPASDRWEAQPSARWNEPPSDGWDVSPSDHRNQPQASRHARSDTPGYVPSNDRRADPPSRRRDDSHPRNTETPSGNWPETPDAHHRNIAPRPRNQNSGAHRHALSGANNPESPHTSESQSQRWTEPPERRRRR
ncbi:hypothetical protein [Nocardia sp. NPDC005998]|uniref:hypothetical protein n=1 Tax=Nocardia sp. NPDC005998 TaxID=3156894 RepID=UPI0033B3051A